MAKAKKKKPAKKAATKKKAAKKKAPAKKKTAKKVPKRAPKKAAAPKRSATISVNPHGKLFVGGGTRVEMAIFDKPNANGAHDVLLRITGAEAHQAGIDGATLLYEAVPAGNGTNFEWGPKSDRRTRMITRSAWGSWEYVEVFLAGQTIKVAYDEAGSHNVAPLHLVTAYLEDN